MNALFTYVISIKQRKAHFHMTINILKRNSKHKTEKIAPPFTSLPLAYVASVSVRFGSKKRGTRVKDRAKNGASTISRAVQTENPVTRVFLLRN